MLNPFSATASIDVDALSAAVGLAVRFLDNILDVSRYPLPQQREQAAYESSIELAKRKGVFPAFEVDGFVASRFVGRLPTKLRDAIARHGIRNCQLIALAPAGSISLLAGNVPSGIEPVFARRRVEQSLGFQPSKLGSQGFSATGP